MNRHSIRSFQKNISQILKEDLPLEITNHGKTVAVVLDPDHPASQRAMTPVMPTMQVNYQPSNRSTKAMLIEFEHKNLSLKKCLTHKVYKKTCGC